MTSVRPRGAAATGRSARQSKPAEIKNACIETLRQAAAIVDAKAPGDGQLQGVACNRSANTLPKRPTKVADSSGLAAFRSATPRKRR